MFINYRREDTAGYAGHLYSDLVAALGSGNVFMDIDTLRPGDPFPDVIDRELATCYALVALIGRQWLEATDASGKRRLDDPTDLLRLELQAALERGVRVIPVIVERAELPGAEDLPAPLRELRLRHAHELSDTRWRYDVDLLVQELQVARDQDAARQGHVVEKGQYLGWDAGEAEQGAARPKQPRKPKPFSARTKAVIAAGVLFLVGAGSAAGILATSSSNSPTVVASLAWAGTAANVSWVRTTAGEPGAFGRFRLNLVAAGSVTVKELTLVTVNARGEPCCGQVWNTTPSDGYWILRVSRAGRLLNPTDAPISSAVKRTAAYDLYAADTGYLQPGQRFRVTATLAGGARVSSRTTIR